jgi:hypothetical protein
MIDHVHAVLVLSRSFISTTNAVDPFVEEKLYAVWNWEQLFNPNKFYLKRTKITALIIDKIML